MYTKILLPMDGSSASWAAIPHAAYLAQIGSAEVTVLGVIDSPIAEAVSHVLLPLGLPEEHDEAERVIDEVRGHGEGPVMGACLRAEAFLRTWRDELPFGRPLAS